MIRLITAISRNDIIGNGLKLPWHLPEDLNRFKKLTSHSVVVMGRKTHESIGFPLPNRVNVIFSKNRKRIHGCSVRYSVNNFLKKYRNENIWIIGGSGIYRLFLPYCDELYITRIYKDIEGDILFPIECIDFNKWKIDSYEENWSGEFWYSFEKYIKGS